MTCGFSGIWWDKVTGFCKNEPEPAGSSQSMSRKPPLPRPNSGLPEFGSLEWSDKSDLGWGMGCAYLLLKL